VERFWTLTATSAPKTWICPGCGASIVLPADCLAASVHPVGRRLDQLAQALCGCWVVILPESGLTRLLEAIVAGEESHEECRRWAASGRL
jgi:hypothetical protein